MIPEKALQYIQDKKLATSFSYKDVWNEEHSSAFSVAKCMQIDVLKDMKDAVESAIEKGETFESFKKNLLPTLEAKGWLRSTQSGGKKLITDPITGEIKEVYINAPHRLKTIYNTNLRSAYQKGRVESTMQSEAHEYLMYRLGPVKSKHRDEHASWDGLILPKHDAWWNSHTPPNGYGCKCYTVAITKERKEKYENKGIPTATTDGESILIKPITTAPKITYKTYYNERKGIVEKVPNGVHPTFNFNPAVATRDLPIFDAFMKKGKASFPTRYEKIAESILTSQVKEEQFTSWVENVFRYNSETKKGTAADAIPSLGRPHKRPHVVLPHNMTGIGFIDTKVANFLKDKGVDIGESVTVGLEARLLNSTKAVRHDLKGEALKVEDAGDIINALLYGTAYFQKDNNYILYLYQTAKDKYLQIAVNPQTVVSGHQARLDIPIVKNIQFINDEQKKSKFDSNEKWEKIK